MPPALTTDHNPALVNLIAQRIQASPQGRISFAEYMERVLYEPNQGYYSANKDKIGAAGDFFTSPHLGNDFGELLAEQFYEMWERLERPVPFTLVEMGAGQGLIAVDVLRYVQTKYPKFLEALEYIIVERAAALIAEQQQRLKAFADSFRWCSLAEIKPDSITGCFFSNELVDALPVHRIGIENRQLQEVYVQLAEASEEIHFQAVLGDLSTSRLADYFQCVGIDLLQDAYPDGYRSEVNLAALDWLQDLAARLHRGYLLTIDYGYTATQYYSPNRSNGTLQCYYQHSHHDNPYLNIGRQDLTAHVDFTALEAQGKICGLETLGFSQQGLFLMALGLGDRLVANNSGKSTSPMETLRRREALHLLMNPLNLGGFGVLIQSKGLQAPQKELPLQGLRQPA